MNADEAPNVQPAADAASEGSNAEDADVVERLFDDLSRLVESLKITGALSLAVSLSEVASRSLLIAAASHFEAQFGEMFKEVSAQLASPALAAFGVNQGVTRKYHTLFSWDAGNANAFYKKFGEDFKSRATARAAQDAEFAKSVGEFVRIGSDRNELIHSDFASFPLTSTLDELIVRYRDARAFLPAIRELLLEEAKPATEEGS